MTRSVIKTYLFLMKRIVRRNSAFSLLIVFRIVSVNKCLDKICDIFGIYIQGSPSGCRHLIIPGASQGEKGVSHR